eukprot:m.126200 g.126200  ORF g.126200 m.126200 type:complete len:53 (+) comp13822_c0_seq2:534-692(+)
MNMSRKQPTETHEMQKSTKTPSHKFVYMDIQVEDSISKHIDHPTTTFTERKS